MTNRRRWVALRRKRLLCSIIALGLAAGVVLPWYMAKNPFPLERLESLPQSAVLFDREGRPLARSLTGEEQWRLPVALEEISPWLRKATIAVEDERFEQHPGVDFVSVGRACLQNLFAGGVVSGASTLDMQLCRMLDPRPRTLEFKLSEASRAWQADVFCPRTRCSRLTSTSLPTGVTFRARRPRHYGISASPQKNFPCPRLPCWPVFLNLPPVCVRIDTRKPRSRDATRCWTECRRRG